MQYSSVTFLKGKEIYLGGAKSRVDSAKDQATITWSKGDSHVTIELMDRRILEVPAHICVLEGKRAEKVEEKKK